jgi:Dolichyl-phosphate-mannose-protein mannosyltransferase
MTAQASQATKCCAQYQEVALNDDSPSPAENLQATSVDRAGFVPLIICAGLLVVGILVRLLRYFANRPLWLDEAALAINIRERTFAGLTKPLDWGQGAPIGFLWLEKTVCSLMGTSEYSLRLIPLIAGLLCLPVFFLVCLRLFDVLTAIVGLSLFAVAESFIYYSSEVKQYSTDTLVALTLVLLCIEAVRSQRTVWMWLLGLGGLFGLFFSHPAIFVLGPIVVYLVVAGGASRRAAFVLAVVWTVAFLTNYFLFLALLLQADQRLVESNSAGFMPFPPRSLTDCKWYFTQLFFVSKYIFSHPTGVGEQIGVGTPIAGLAAALAIVGVVYVARDRRPALVILLGPIILVLIASAMKKYPFSGRLILFLLPLQVLLIAVGLTFPWAGNDRRQRLTQVVMFAMLSLTPWLSAVNGVMRPPVTEDVRPIFAHIQQHRQPTDVLYLYAGADKAFDFYGPSFGLSKMPIVAGTGNMRKATDKPSDLLALRGTKRVWIVFSFLSDRRGSTNEMELVLCLLDSMGKRLDQVTAEGASGYLYDLSGDARVRPPSQVGLLRSIGPGVTQDAIQGLETVFESDLLSLAISPAVVRDRDLVDAAGTRRLAVSGRELEPRHLRCYLWLEAESVAF